MWCTPTKQGTSRTGQAILRYGQIVFGIGVENDSSVDFEIFFLCTLICLLSPPCNFWLIFKHFSTKKKKKKKKNLHFLQPTGQIQTYRKRELKGRYAPKTLFFLLNMLDTSYLVSRTLGSRKREKCKNLLICIFNWRPSWIWRCRISK